MHFLVAPLRTADQSQPDGARFLSADDEQSLDRRGTCTVISALVAIARTPRRHASDAVQDVRCLLFAGAMPAEVVTALSELMRVPASLESIEFDGNAFDDEDVRVLALAARESTTLRELTIARNVVGIGALAMLAHAVCCSRSLTTLCITECEPVPELGAALGGALGTNPVLQSLVVSANSLQSHDALHLARGLRGNTHLTLLDLSANDIGGEGIEAICAALCQNTALTSLDIASSTFGAATAAALGDLLLVNTRIRYLDLADTSVLDAGAAHLARGLSVNTTLEAINLVSCAIGIGGCIALADALLVNRGVRLAILAHNQIGFEGMAGIERALRGNDGLRRVVMDRGGTGDDSWMDNLRPVTSDPDDDNWKQPRLPT